MNKKTFLASLAVGVASLSVSASPALAKKMEKCYGISKAAQNHCGNCAGTHSCAGQARVDFDPGEWKFVPKGTCESVHNGSTKCPS